LAQILAELFGVAQGCTVPVSQAFLASAAHLGHGLKHFEGECFSRDNVRVGRARLYSTLDSINQVVKHAPALRSNDVFDGTFGVLVFSDD